MSFFVKHYVFRIDIVKGVSRLMDMANGNDELSEVKLEMLHWECLHFVHQFLQGVARYVLENPKKSFLSCKTLK